MILVIHDRNCRYYDDRYYSYNRNDNRYRPSAGYDDSRYNDYRGNGYDNRNSNYGNGGGSSRGDQYQGNFSIDFVEHLDVEYAFDFRSLQSVLEP